MASAIPFTLLDEGSTHALTLFLLQAGALGEHERAGL